MPGRTLPLISSTELQRHRTAASCYVSYGGRVFDLTSFLDDHPGGGDLILEYGGRDVQEIMGDEVSHMHSESAYEILEDSVVGLLDEIPCSKISTQKMSLSAHDGQQASPKVQDDRPPSGASLAEASPESSASLEAELSLETNAVDDFRRHRFLDLNRPLLMQVWNGGFSKDFYLAEVHRPRHYKGGKSAPLFGNFLEPLSKTPWWAVPSIWLPSVIYGTVLSREGMNGWGHVATFWLSGLAIWTLVEYGLHRCLFHVDRWVLLVDVARLRPLAHSLSPVDIFQITRQRSPLISCYTAFTTTSPWTSSGSSCHRCYSSFSQRLFGSWSTSSSTGTGMPQ